jgi:hypothetical protein
MTDFRAAARTHSSTSAAHGAREKGAVMKIIAPTPRWFGPFSLPGLALLGAALLGACDKQAITVARPATTADTFALTADWPAFAQAASSKMDILFMVDDSSSMIPLQAKLAAGFAEVMTVLQNLPGGTPDLHLGVVSSSMGAGRNPSIAGCAPGGDQGILQNTPRGSTCAGVQLTDRFIAVHTDATTHALVTNYGAASLADAFGCIAPLGQQGCGFEQQLSSVRHALDPALAPPANAGFLRADAFLAIVLITNEDDCSAPADTDLFDSTSAMVSDPLGPLQSYRCNEFGHLCLIDGKLQHPPRGMATDALQGCRSAEDGRLDKVADFVSFLKGLKGDPARIFLAAVTGPATPYLVGLAPAMVNTDPAQWPYVLHSCTAADGTYADPAVRLAQTVTAFGSHGLLSSICDDTMGPILRDIATRFSQPVGSACVATPNPAGPGCVVVDRFVDDSGNHTATRLPACADAGGATPCWSLVADTAACGPDAKKLDVDRGGVMVPSTLVTAIDCTSPHP